MLSDRVPALQRQIEQFEARRANFSEVNKATLESNLVPRIQEIFTSKGVNVDCWWAFDAIELSVGTPVPVLTRYVSPVYDFSQSENPSEELEVTKSEMYLPGFAIYAIRGNYISLQVGLGEKEVLKIARRFTVLEENGKINADNLCLGNKPPWWNYAAEAVEMTQPYDLPYAGDMEDMRATIETVSVEKSFDDDLAWKIYIFDGGSRHKDVQYVDISKPDQDGNLTSEWNMRSREIEIGLQNIAKFVDQLK